MQIQILTSSANMNTLRSAYFIPVLLTEENSYQKAYPIGSSFVFILQIFWNWNRENSPTLFPSICPSQLHLIISWHYIFFSTCNLLFFCRWSSSAASQPRIYPTLRPAVSYAATWSCCPCSSWFSPAWSAGSSMLVSVRWLLMFIVWSKLTGRPHDGFTSCWSYSFLL